MISVFLTGQRTFGAAALEALGGLPFVKVEGVAAPGAGEDRLRHEAQRRGLSWIPSEAFRAELVPEVDVILAAHSHAFLSRKARARARMGAYGYHPSLLPRHRGRDAVRWTIHMRDPIAGGSIYRFTNNVDAGPLLLQDWLHVDPRWDHHDLWRELFGIGICLLIQTVEILDEDSNPRLVPQNPAVVTWEPSWERPPLHRPDLLELGR